MITVNFCEYSRFNQDYDTIFRPQGSGDYLFLLFKTPMKVYLGGELQITKENACLLYTPGQPQHYQAVRRFGNSYLHFSSGEDPSHSYAIPANQIFYPENYVEVDDFIRRLQQEYLSNSPHREAYIHALCTQMFISLSRSLSRTANVQDQENLYPLFLSLRLRMLTDCQEDWNLERLCGYANLEKSQFYHYYRKFFSTSPKYDLLQVRLEKAKNLLSNEALQVNEVARLCGFSSLAHFSRYFKKCCGCPPGEYGRHQGRKTP